MQDEQASGQRPAVGEDSPAEAAQRPAVAGGPASPDVPAAEPRTPATGEARVDEALARLDELPGLPVTEHPAVFEQVHRRLQEVLGELDTGPAGEAGEAAGPGAAASQRGPGR